MGMERNETNSCSDLPSIPADVGLACRTNFLVGKTIKGVLMHRRGGYFIKWNDEIADAVYISSETVERCLPQIRQPGLVAVVKCTIEKLGPNCAHWTKQHPISKSVSRFQGVIPGVTAPRGTTLTFTSRMLMKPTCKLSAHQKRTRPRFINSRFPKSRNVPMTNRL